MLKKKDYLKCRLCKVNKGDIFYSKRDSETKKRTSLYLTCNKCNTNRLRKYRHKHKERIKEIVKKYEDKNKDKRNAWNEVAYALKTNKLIKPNQCSICDEKTKVEAHHEDYTKPLEVRWVCRLCHNKQHKNMII